MKNDIYKLLMSLFVAISVSGVAVAGSFSDKQQQDLKAAQSVWEKKDIPAGMQSGDLRSNSDRDSGAENVSIYVENVNFDVVENIGFHVENLSATLEPKTKGEPVVFDDVESFTINVHSGSVVLSSQVISDLFNNHILDYWPRPLDELVVNAKDGYLEVEADLKLWSWFPGIWLPANLGGQIVLNADNKLVYDIDDVRVLGIPLYGLLSALFIDLDLLLSVEREGAELVDSVLVLDHTKVFPPPTLAGKIESASLTEDGLRLTFADNTNAQFRKPPQASDSYIWAQSGDPRLFGIVVTNGTVQVVADDTSKPLRFNLYDYRSQVSQGTLKMLKNGDIIATIPSSTGPDFSPTAGAGSTVSRASDAGTAPAAPKEGCINRAGFNVCEEEPVKRAEPVAQPKAAETAAEVEEQVQQDGLISTEERMKLKEAAAGTCFNRAGFEVPCK